jgi:hypothetical protein
MGIIVIACYRPHHGKEQELLAETRQHVDILRGEGLVTDREPIIGQAPDGTIVEVFEWKSQHAIDQAHENPVVLDMWARYAACCDYVPIAEVPGAADLFSPFLPLEP